MAPLDRYQRSNTDADPQSPPYPSTTAAQARATLGEAPVNSVKASTSKTF